MPRALWSKCFKEVILVNLGKGKLIVGTEKLRKNLRVQRKVLILSRFFSILVLGVVLTATVGCAGVTKGPVLLRVSEDRAALMWETEVEGPGKVLYGKGNVLDGEVTTEPIQVEYGINKKAAFIHKTWLEYLEPGQTYSYRVTGPKAPVLQRIATLGRSGIQSKVYKFRTVPEDTNEVTFLVYGDSRTRPKVHRRVVEQMLDKKADFVVHSGDLVSSGDHYEQFGPQYFEPVKGLAENVPIYIAKGNHEGKKGNFEKLLVPDGRTNTFGFDYGPVHVFCVDNYSSGLTVQEQLRQIADDARKSTAQWKFVCYHKPSLNFGGHWSDWGYPDALRLLSEAGVDFVLTGHSHQYERFRPVAPPPDADGTYVTHITCGGGGAPLYGVKPSLYHAKATAEIHFCLFNISDNKLTMDTFDIDGKVIDHLEIIKIDGRPNKQYLWTAVPMAAVRLHQDLHRTEPKKLSKKPKKDQSFNIYYKLSVPALGEQAKMTFKLGCEEGTYKLPEPKTLTIPEEGGTFNVELTAIPLTDVKVPNNQKPIEPALWLECHYEIGRVKEHISHSIVAKP
jgi:predicted phosphodiesterase